MFDTLSEDKIAIILNTYYELAVMCETCHTVRGGMIYLSPSERDTVIAKAQKNHTLKQVIEWGNGDCPHNTELLPYAPYVKADCQRCWGELQKEVEK